MENDTWFYLALVALVLIGAGLLLPGNRLTGNAILKEPACGRLGCSELCTPGEETCAAGMTCCPTVWETNREPIGLCDYPENCAMIADYPGSLEEYVTYRQEEPLAIRNIAWQTFWLPLAVVGVVFFVLLRKDRGS